MQKKNTKIMKKRCREIKSRLFFFASAFVLFGG